MDRVELRKRYFDWLYKIAYHWETESVEADYSFTKLASALFDIPFIVEIPRDENRVQDALSLRYSFGSKIGLDDREIIFYLDDKQCSVFEVMVALAKRCESQLMSDYLYGDRTSYWFNEMIVSLGLGGMYNKNFDSDRVKHAVDIMLHHQFEPNGKGGLFTVKRPIRDLRSLELWAQMCDHLNELLY